MQRSPRIVLLIFNVVAVAVWPLRALAEQPPSSQPPPGVLAPEIEGARPSAEDVPRTDDTLGDSVSEGGAGRPVELQEEAPSGTRPDSAVEGSVLVHIDSPQPVQLMRQAEDDDEVWGSVCSSPCDELVPLEGTYRIQADGVVKSSEFRFKGKSGEGVTLKVDPSSSTVRALGIAVAIVGVAPLTVAVVGGIATFIVAGVVVLFACSLADAVGGSFNECSSDVFGDVGNAYWSVISHPAGWGTIVGGLALTAGGTIMIMKNRRTRLNQEVTVGAVSPGTQYGWLPLPPVVETPSLTLRF